MNGEIKEIIEKLNKSLFYIMKTIQNSKEVEVAFEKSQRYYFENKIVLYQYIPDYILEQNENIIDAFIIAASSIANNMSNSSSNENFTFGKKTFMQSFACNNSFTRDYKNKIIAKLAVQKNKKEIIKFIVKYILPYCNEFNYKKLACDVAFFNTKVLNNWVKDFYRCNNNFED